MRGLRISDARAIGELLRAEGVLIIAWRPGANPDQFALASWGRTKANCEALGKFLDGPVKDFVEIEGPDL
jgi:hypothetical protein